MNNRCLPAGQVIGEANAWCEGIERRVDDAAGQAMKQRLHVWVVVNRSRDHLFGFIRKPGYRAGSARYTVPEQL